MHLFRLITFRGASGMGGGMARHHFIRPPLQRPTTRRSEAPEPLPINCNLVCTSSRFHYNSESFLASMIVCDNLHHHHINWAARASVHRVDDYYTDDDKGVIENLAILPLISERTLSDMQLKYESA